MIHESLHLNYSLVDEIPGMSMFDNKNEDILGERFTDPNNSEISLFNLDLTRHPKHGHNVDYLKIRRFLSLGSLSLRK